MRTRCPSLQAKARSCPEDPGADSRVRTHRPSRPQESGDQLMYRYDSVDRDVVEDRALEFRDQVRRRLSGELSKSSFDRSA